MADSVLPSAESFEVSNIIQLLPLTASELDNVRMPP